MEDLANVPKNKPLSSNTVSRPKITDDLEMSASTEDSEKSLNELASK